MVDASVKPFFLNSPWQLESGRVRYMDFEHPLDTGYRRGAAMRPAGYSSSEATMTTGICYVCGRLLVSAGTGKPVPGVERNIGGNPVRMHKGCAETFDSEAPTTARAATTASGATIASDKLVLADDGTPSVYVFRRGAGND